MPYYYSKEGELCQGVFKKRKKFLRRDRYLLWNRALTCRDRRPRKERSDTIASLRASGPQSATDIRKTHKPVGDGALDVPCLAICKANRRCSTVAKTSVTRRKVDYGCSTFSNRWRFEKLSFAKAKLAPLTNLHGKLVRLLRKPVSRQKAKAPPDWVVPLLFGADYGARTRHLDLGKVALYQMS